jgi:sec-independent protein translocase protein TatA
MTPPIPFITANIFGPDLLIVAGIVVLLFGGSQIPKIARSLGQASKEFKSGQDEVAERSKQQQEDKGNPPPTDPGAPTS